MEGKKEIGNIPKLILSFGLSLVTGGAAFLFSMNASEIYGALKKPVFAPPAWVFGPVWAVLYILIAVALYLVLKKGMKQPNVKNALLYYCIQLVFNILWSALFFTLNLRAAALVDIIILLVYATITTVKFFRIDKAAGVLMILYLLWILFATVLNLALVILNG